MSFMFVSVFLALTSKLQRGDTMAYMCAVLRVLCVTAENSEL